jgi:hypothetical protein
MAGSTGSARDEAERLVATVLAIASEQDLSRTRQRVTEGIGALSGSLANLVKQVTGDAPAPDSAPPPAAGKAPEEPKPAPAAPAPADLWSWVSDGLNSLTGGTRPGTGPGAKRGTGPGAKRGGGSGGAAGLGGFAGWSTGFAGWSTGSAECCVCPVCKAIAAARNPSPRTALRLATGAGDVATGAARVMRGLSTLAGTSAKPAKPARPTRPVFDPDVTWSAATRAAGPHETPAPPRDPATQDPWSAATRTPTPKPAPPAAHPAAPSPPAQKPAAQTPPVQTPPAQKRAAPDEATRRRDPWAAATASLPPIAHVAPDGEGVQHGTASGGPETRTETGVEDHGPGSSGRTAVDHDGPGPATAGPGSAQAASAADGRDGESGDGGPGDGERGDGGPGDDARAGDAG